ncbi:MAG TPA: hypothetical protein PKE40_05110 [Arachnia sp.]|nr:hypothetical protein [Arachnia sp.]HMT85713.1 hypothetical protein [Arachnia sp.]
MNGGVLNWTVRPGIPPDAVVVVPGIMGSTLTFGNEVLWGGHRLGWYRKAWTSEEDNPLAMLSLSEDEQERALAKCDPAQPLTQTELDGFFGGIHASGLLRKPAWAPFLRGLEPYGELVKAISNVVVHRDAICEFAYDWRLPVAYNARRLEHRIRSHLATWRDHPEYHRFREELPDKRPAKVVVVAHSMGGLLARSLPDGLDIRATVTLGTPFDGAAMAPLVLHTGRRTPIPLPPERLRTMASTLPGIHDLLPTYRCLDDVTHDAYPTRLTPEFVEAIGGSRELAQASFDWQERTNARSLPGHHAVVGINQPTASTLTYKNGVLTGHPYTFEITKTGLARDKNGFLDRQLRGGDGTVPRNSAEPRPSGVRPTAFAQQHGPLASMKESTDLICDVLLQRDPDAPRLSAGGQGDSGIGLDVPDITLVGEPVAFVLAGVSGAAGTTVSVHDELGRQLQNPVASKADGVVHFKWTPSSSGIYQVVASRGGMDVKQRFLATQA